MVRHIVFGGISTKDYEAIVDGAEAYGGAERDIESVAIPGRNGELTIDHGRYNNVQIPYNILFRSVEMLEAYRSRIMAMSGYHRLEDSRHPEEYRRARIRGGFLPKMSGVGNRRGEVEITFDCMPQRYLKSGERPVVIKQKTNILNPTGMDAAPLIRVFGHGVLTVGETAVTVGVYAQEYADIDCELGECYSGDVNLNGKLELSGSDFPFLGAGETEVSISGEIERVVLYPRWWRI